MAKRQRAELKRMWREFSQTGDADLRARLIEAYLPLVSYQARRMKANLPACVDVRDLVSAGRLGLIDAVDKFRPGRGVLFETYCSTRIRGAILDDLRSGDWVPRAVRRMVRHLEKVKLELASKLGRGPADEEIARRMKLKLPEFYALLEKTHVKVQIPIEGMHVDAGDGEDVRPADLFADRSCVQPLDGLAASDARKEIREVALKGLSPKERAVLIGYHFEGRNMKDIGEDLGVSESRVSQINKQLVVRLRERFRDCFGRATERRKRTA